MDKKDKRSASPAPSHNTPKLVINWCGKPCAIEQVSHLAMQEYRNHNLPEAIDIYSRIIAQAPGYTEAYFNRGVILQSMQRPAEALADYDKALTCQPDNALIHNNRGTALHEMQRWDEALASYGQALALRPAYAEAYNNRGNSLQALNRLDEALADYAEAIVLNPNYVQAYANQGTALQKLQRYQEALASCNKVVALQPRFAKGYNSRGNILQQIECYEEALADYDRAITLNPGYAEAYNNRGNPLQELKRHDEALASYLKAVSIKPDYASAYNNIGNILVSKGKMPEAEAMFMKARELKPDFSNPLYNLANIRTYRDVDHDDIKAIRTLIDHPATSQRDQSYLYFALGKIHDDCRRYDEAWDYYHQANRIAGDMVDYQPEVIRQTTDAIIEQFSADFLSRRLEFASSSKMPLFIVGMPRSGTTLMASILSNHPAIANAGELPTIIENTLRLPQMLANAVPYPQAVRHLEAAHAPALIERYEQRLTRDYGSGMAYIIDKHPFNFRHLGFIALLFPDAHIIHCTRHPLDTGLSNYFHRFSLAHSYAFDLENIGHFYNHYTRLMAHWWQVLPIKMLEVSYEEMITDTKATAARALDFLGLDWDERCLTPHTNPYPVETSSQWQVRQPIYRQSLERWRHYEKHLSPLRQVLLG